MVTGDKEIDGSGSINDRASEDVATGCWPLRGDSHQGRLSRLSH